MPSSDSTKKRRAEVVQRRPYTKRRRLIAGCEVVRPEEVGLNPEPLDRLRGAVNNEVNKLGSLSGVAHLILKDGKCVFSHSDGYANIEAGARFGLNTLCYLHSCTKPLVVAAFMTLVDRGEVKLSDPIDLFLPFSKSVANGPHKSVRRAKKRPTLHHLVTQTGGIRHSDERAYAKVRARLQRREIQDLAGFCDALMKVPLQSEPGTLHYYSLSIDILGRVCEVVSGKDLDSFVRERLLDPLGMCDTHFAVPASKLGRKAQLYDCKLISSGIRPYASCCGKLARAAEGDKTVRKGQVCRAYAWKSDQMHPGVFSGGGGVLSYSDAGMYGTAEDYARFCQMLLDGGKAPDGTRVLKKKTVDSFFEDCLTPFAGPDGKVHGWNDYDGPEAEARFYWDHHAWSPLNATIDLERPPKKSGPPRRGHTLWMYGMGAYWFVDTRRKLVAVSFAQNFNEMEGGCWKENGSDCVALAKEAVDSGPAGVQLATKHEKDRKLEIFYGKEPDPSWKKVAEYAYGNAAKR